MMLRSLLFLPLAVAVYQFDNSLTDKPRIECGHDHVALSVKTANDLPAHVFAKGHFKKDGCSFSNSTHVIFNFDQCDVTRRREANPRGMSYSMTIVVQLHPLFVTKVDKMFHVRCFYQETDKGVGVELPVGDLPTESLPGNAELPSCNYTLHKDSANGPIIKYANVGDLIYHVWDCPSDIYAMMVHSCYIADGSGSQYLILDEQGCSMENYLMPALTYSASLSKAITASNAFLIPDQTSVFFNCQIRYCVKGTESCSQITPPQCGGSPRPKGTQEPDIQKEFNQDQLMTAPTTPQTIKTTTGKPFSTTRIPSSTTRSPSSTTKAATSTTRSPSSTTRLPSSTTTSVPETTTMVTVTVTEMSRTTTGVPTSTILILPRRLPPRQQEVKEALNDSIEGSGLEIFPTTAVHLILADQVSNKEVYLRPGDVTPPDVSSDKTSGRRELKRRDTVIDVDISSPEVTFVDKEFGIPEPAEALTLEKDPKQGERICVSLIGFWAVCTLGVLCLSILGATLCYAQRQRNKFRMLP